MSEEAEELKVKWRVNELRRGMSAKTWLPVAGLARI